MFDPQNPVRGWSLLWPREVFRHELAAIVSQIGDYDQRDALSALFDEALSGPDPQEDLTEVPDGPHPDWSPSEDPWSTTEPTRGTAPIENYCRAFGRELLLHVDQLPVYTPRRYYLTREFEQAMSASATTPAPPDTEATEVAWPGLRRAWISVIADLVENGYLDRLAGDRCEDNKENEQPAKITALLEKHVGLGPSWPFEVDDPDLAIPEVFLSYVEALHDLVARPRVRVWHDYDEHYWYRGFDASAGQKVYRWKVNDLLVRFNVDLQLAESGEDQGLLVHRVLDPRQELITQVAAHVPDRNRNLVDHAVAQFRRRGATLEEKRSACTALAHVLEDRTPLVTRLMNKKDESDLFNIANNFAIRHQNAKQRTDYAEEYLDWIFWSFLAAVELTNHLIRRQEGIAADV